MTPELESEKKHAHRAGELARGAARALRRSAAGDDASVRGVGSASAAHRRGRRRQAVERSLTASPETEVKDRIQSWASILLGGAVVVLVGWLTIDQMGTATIAAETSDGGGVTCDARRDRFGLATQRRRPRHGPARARPERTALGARSKATRRRILAGPQCSARRRGAMPSGAPRTVKLGVVLVQFAGAEGASSSARAKPDALEARGRARGAGAAATGRPPSRPATPAPPRTSGGIPRGVLDRATEVAVFSLAKDDVSEPLETPRATGSSSAGSNRC